MSRAVLLAMIFAASVVNATPALPPSAIDPSDMQAQINAARAADHDASEAAGAGLQSGVETGIAWGRYGVDLVNSARELENSYHALTTFDRNCMDLSPSGSPQIPASCAGPGHSGCDKCYQDAERELNGMRLNLERLRCYYNAYHNFVTASISFGDTASGIHAVTGLAWQNARAGIVAEFENLKHTYDRKRDQMLPNLQLALQHIGQCESEFFHEPDWYARFGNLYYAFMSDRYKRAD